MKLIDNGNANAQKLLKEARELNQSLENSYLALAVVLVEIEEKELWRETEYKDFADFYTRDLGREKSTVSRLLTCGRWLKENKLRLPAGNFGYKRLSQAIKHSPDKSPEHVLALAETWDSNDFKEDVREQCKHPDEPILVCKHCFKRMS